ncbi:alpha/beta hydrolase [Kitasatospora sp. RB6PN24]|uniref:alpha/beta hydrolase n=1 Tax=Kitasatospora humi TaxID=2893891 RepID=UPI001E5D4F9B|nr:alpha/beta hydrolase [Kitasatospora humi]MCC9306072.1 alpha/beta hydrolase [Kitasatospora humi]
MTLIVPDGTDPELVRAAGLQPDLDFADPVRVRAAFERAFKFSKALRPAAPEGLTTTDRYVPAREGAPDVLVRVYDPADRVPASAALVFFHGGAFVSGDLETEDARCAEIARRTGALVVSVDYRLAPEHPFPAGFQDCYDVLVWVAENAAELGVDPDRIAVGGSSAGGALAAAVSLAARDLGGPRIMLQMLLYPVIDDALETASMRAFTTTPGWNQPNSVHMWNHYLGTGDRGEVSPYAAPWRATDLTGLPPAYVMTAEFDPLRDEGIRYAVRLLAADVPTELHQFPGAFHGFDAAAPEATLTRRSLDEQCAVLLRAAAVVAEPAPAGV